MEISRKNLRGFTLIELLAILILLGILIAIAIPVIGSIVKEAKAKICVLDAKVMEIAADNYVSRDAITIKNGESRVITLKELQTAGYISPMFSPYAKKTACTGYVVVTNEGNSGADYYTFQSALKCGNSCTTSNYDVSKDDTGSSNDDTDPDSLKDDMKEKNNDWYFEGSNPNNWVKFGMVDGITNRGILWRIVKIDNTGIKMVYEGLENGSDYPLEDGRALIDGTMGIAWNTSGTNKWNEPASLEGKLNEWLSLLNIPDESRYLSKISWKVGGVPYQSPTLIGTFNHYQAIDSSDVGGSFDGLSKNQSYVGTINAIDFMYTSDNENCSKSYLETGSSNECAYSPQTGEINNFLQKNKYLYWTLNARSDVSNMSWDISNSGLIGSNTVTLPTISVRPVLNLKLDSKFISGTGTIEDPYLLEDYMIGLTDRPLITLNGDSTIYVRQYDSYEDQGATALDTQDGDLTSEISTTGSVNINVPGDYEIKYNVSDSDGNAAVTVIRKVIVIERDLPIIKLNGSNPTYVTITKNYIESGATAYDINYGDISSSIVISGTVDTSTLGTYYIKYNVTNEDGIKGPEVIRKVIVKVPVPEIELNGDNQVLVDIGTSYTEQGATATDEVDGDLTSAITQRIEYYNTTTKAWQNVSSINTSSLAKYRIKYSVTNSYGANSYVYRNIQIVKVSGPIITYTPNNGSTSKKSWQTVINIAKRNYDVVTSSQKYLIKSNWSYTDVGDIDNYKSSYTDGQKITMSRGTAYYTIYARAFDTYGDLTLKASGRFRVDNSKPYIDINGGTVNILLGHTYIDKGATAYDDYFDGNLTSKIITTSNVDTSKLGTYYVTYKVTDSAGNTTTKSRKVIVYHPKPEIYLKGGSTIDLLYGTPYVEKGATAYDEIDGNITSNLTITGSVDHMHEGTYYITYSVTNSSGYSSSRTRTVNVYIPKPVVTVTGSTSIKLLIHQSYVDQGATALDTLDGNLTSRIVTTGSVNPEIPGNYTITYTVTNNLGKVGTATRKITVYQPEPQITINGNSNIEILKTRTYVDLGATATDQIDGNITSNIVTSSNVNTAVAGTYYVSYTVTNSEGITSNKKRTVVVREPVVTLALTGASTVNLPIGKTYTDLGATAYDELLGNVTSAITTTNNINPYTLGTYYVNYRITTSGVTKTAKRTVKVVPLAGPVITFSKNGDGTYKQNNETTVTVTKSEYDVVASSIKYVWSTSQTDPSEASFTTSLASGDTISTPSVVTGKYYLFVIAKDVYGNTSILGSNAFYLDNIKPVLSLKGNRVFQTPVDGTYADPGVNVLEENSGLNSNGVVITSNIITGVIGTYTVTYNATDKAGNVATPITRTVSVVEAGLRDAPGDDFVQLYDASYFVGSNPNNWVEFGNAASNIYDYIPIMWRIIKADDGGIKIIYEGVKNDAKTAVIQNGTIGTNIFDSTNNIWNRPASIRTTLNNFYTDLNEPDKDTLTTKINWCVGTINSPYSLDEFKNNSCTVLSDTTSSIGLIGGKDYILTSKDPCSGYNQASCGTNNFLKKSYSYFTANGDATSSAAIFIANSNGGLTRTQVSDTMNVRPVINLRNDVLILGGEGTFENPYKLNSRIPRIDNDPPVVTFNPTNSINLPEDKKIEVVVTDAITGVDDTSLKYVWTTSSSQPAETLIINSFTNGDRIEIPAASANYYLWVLAKDRKGNQVITKAGPYLSDSVAPVITLNGDATEKVLLGATYTDAGATALDDIDGDVSSRIVVTSNVNPAVEGDYTVTYTVTDNNGNKATVTRTVQVRIQTVFEFPYTGNYQTFTALQTGYYKIELWGAQGGKGRTNNSLTIIGGNGSYTSGLLKMVKGDILYVYIGGKGADSPSSSAGGNGGYNGGGKGGNDTSDDEGTGGGGGASDVRLVSGLWNDFNSLKSRLMVAAGGAGASVAAGGPGGGVSSAATCTSSAATQTTGYSFGTGQTGTNYNYVPSSGGGGGYYGGYSRHDGTTGGCQSATGGSSYVSGFETCNAITSTSISTAIVATGQPIHYSNRYFDEISIIPGNGPITSPTGTNETGHVGNGYGRISYAGEVDDSLTITINGASTVTQFKTDTYVDLGATATDVEDGNLTSSIVTTTNINVNAVGTYKVAYKVTDSSGHVAYAYRYVKIISNEFSYAYNGNYQTFTVPVTGKYKIELWGARGGYGHQNDSNVHLYGRGAYTTGELSLTQGQVLYVYIGGVGGTPAVNSCTGGAGGYNGGGKGANDNNCDSDPDAGGGGGGATDVRLTSGLWNDFNSLKSRIMVAAGGGGSNYGGVGGAGGTLSGIGGYNTNNATYIPTQTFGYGFGIGMPGGGACTDGAGGGGSGYYGGKTGASCSYGGAGGSSFISGYTGCNAITESSISTAIVHTGQANHYSGIYFSNVNMINGNSVMPSVSGATETGHSDNGAAKFTYLVNQ